MDRLTPLALELKCLIVSNLTAVVPRYSHRSPLHATRYHNHPLLALSLVSRGCLKMVEAQCCSELRAFVTRFPSRHDLRDATAGRNSRAALMMHRVTNCQVCDGHVSVGSSVRADRAGAVCFWCDWPHWEARIRRDREAAVLIINQIAILTTAGADAAALRNMLDRHVSKARARWQPGSDLFLLVISRDEVLASVDFDMNAVEGIVARNDPDELGDEMLASVRRCTEMAIWAAERLFDEVRQHVQRNWVLGLSSSHRLDSVWTGYVRYCEKEDESLVIGDPEMSQEMIVRVKAMEGSRGQNYLRANKYFANHFEFI